MEVVVSVAVSSQVFIFSFNYSKVRLDPQSEITVWINGAKLALVV